MSTRSGNRNNEDENDDRTGRSDERINEKSKGKRGFGRSNNQSDDRDHRDERRDKSPDDSRSRKRRKTDSDRYKREIRLIDLPIDFDLETLDPFIKPFHSNNARFSTESLDLLDSIKQSKRYDRDARLSVVVEFETAQWVKQFYTAWNTRLIINKQSIKFETPSFIQPTKPQDEQKSSTNQSNISIQSNPMAGLFQQTVDDIPRVDQSVPQSINQFMKQFYVSPTQQPVRQPQPVASNNQSNTSDPPHSQFSSISISHQQSNDQTVQPLSIQRQYDLSALLSLHSSEPTQVLCLRDLSPPCLDRDVIRYAFAAHSPIEWIHVSVPHASALIRFPSINQAQNVKQLCDSQKIKLDKCPLTVMFAKPNPVEQPINQSIEQPINQSINQPISQSVGQSNMAFDAQSGRWYIPERGLYYDQETQQWMPMIRPQPQQPVAQSHQTNHSIVPSLLSDPKVFDCDKFICWLCERVFADLKHLTWHAETSELHQANASATKDAVTSKYLNMMNQHRAIEVTEGVRPLLK